MNIFICSGVQSSMLYQRKNQYNSDFFLCVSALYRYWSHMFYIRKHKCLACKMKIFTGTDRVANSCVVWCLAVTQHILFIPNPPLTVDCKVISHIKRWRRDRLKSLFIIEMKILIDLIYNSFSGGSFLEITFFITFCFIFFISQYW